jgi:GNAT superfamily N-acetyltransferase
MFKISHLTDHPEFIERLAPPLTEYWRSINPEESLEWRISRLNAHLNSKELPIAWVAHSDNEVYGTAALRLHDLPGREDLTPWLGGVFVLPEHRRRGIGAALCKLVEDEARSMQGISTLYLFTLDQLNWYTKLGWAMHDKSSWCGRPVDIMFKNLK